MSDSLGRPTPPKLVRRDPNPVESSLGLKKRQEEGPHAELPMRVARDVGIGCWLEADGGEPGIETLVTGI